MSVTRHKTIVVIFHSLVGVSCIFVIYIPDTWIGDETFIQNNIHRRPVDYVFTLYCRNYPLTEGVVNAQRYTDDILDATRL